MRITLDRTRCTGHGRCYVVAAAVFAVALDGMRGQPPPPAKTRGPAWYRKMDRNRDGDVSRKEFLDMAVLLQKQAMELRKETQAAAAGADIPPEAAEAEGVPPKS